MLNGVDMVRKKRSYVYKNIVIAAFLLSTSIPYLFEVNTGIFIWIFFNWPILLILMALGFENLLDQGFIFLFIATLLNASLIVFLNVMIYKQRNKQKSAKKDSELPSRPPLEES